MVRRVTVQNLCEELRQITPDRPAALINVWRFPNNPSSDPPRTGPPNAAHEPRTLCTMRSCAASYLMSFCRSLQGREEPAGREAVLELHDDVLVPSMHPARHSYLASARSA